MWKKCCLHFANRVEQGIQKFFLPSLSNDGAVSEEESLTVSAGDTDIGLSRFSGSVNGTAHQGDGQGLVHNALTHSALFKLPYQRNEVDTRAPTGRARNDGKHRARAERE